MRGDKECPFVAQLNLAEFRGRCRKANLSLVTSPSQEKTTRLATWHSTRCARLSNRSMFDSQILSLSVVVCVSRVHTVTNCKCVLKTGIQ